MLIIMLSLALLGSLVNIYLMKRRSVKRIVEIVLLYLVGILFGLSLGLAGLMHIFNGPATAQLIGWPAGSPFQYEVGVADLALGALGLLCFVNRKLFLPAAIWANSLFLFGCLAGHVHSFIKSGNLAAYNIGPGIIIGDGLVPLAIIVIYLVFLRLKED